MQVTVVFFFQHLLACLCQSGENPSLFLSPLPRKKFQTKFQCSGKNFPGSNGRLPDTYWMTTRISRKSFFRFDDPRTSSASTYGVTAPRSIKERERWRSPDHICVATMVVAFLSSTLLLALAVAVNPVVALVRLDLTKRLGGNTKTCTHYQGINSAVENYQSASYLAAIRIGNPPKTCKW